MKDAPEPSDYHVHARSTLAEAQARALKDDELFGIFDRRGDILDFDSSPQGIYHGNTRFLSRLELRVDGAPPLLLSSTVQRVNPVLVADLTNPDIDGRADAMPADAVHICRSRFLSGHRSWERFELRNHATRAVSLTLSLAFDADYRDVFEVRGAPRERRGRMLAPRVDEDTVVISYQGLDDVVRETELRFDPPPMRLEAGLAECVFELSAGQSASLELTISCREITTPARRVELARPDSHATALRALEAKTAAARERSCGVTTSNELFNEWLDRSFEDLLILTTETEHGPYPYAGIPWFSAAFGRDGLITALQRLWTDPDLTRGVLRFLAAHQARTRDELADAEPGKILHETRRGEMAALGEVPFRHYYGSIDSTPLFVYVAGAYFLRTGDRALVEELWPAIVAALRWIEEEGDRDGDGFVEYGRRAKKGLDHQGWKDSHDSIFHDDGRDAEPPIALCEVQAYVFGALQMAGVMADALGDDGHAQRLRRRAEALRRRFEEAFWLEDEGLYALALDGQKRPCRVRSSNAGQCLLTGIASAERAARVVETLMSPRHFSGWGIRTIAAEEPRFNPLSYHNGSIWPHDNALIALGMARHGHNGAAARILEGLFDAARHFELHRLPELFCGFPRRAQSGPVIYPVACEPQAWAAGSVYMLLQASLGLTIDARQRKVTFELPRLPAPLEWVELRSLRVGDGEVDLRIDGRDSAVAIQVLRKRGEVHVSSVQ